MNKIVVPHYPVEKLPVELQAGLNAADVVTVTLDLETREVMSDSEEALALEDLFALAAKLPRKTTDEIVKEIRALRDEWD